MSIEAKVKAAIQEKLREAIRRRVKEHGAITNTEEGRAALRDIIDATLNEVLQTGSFPPLLASRFDYDVVRAERAGKGEVTLTITATPKDPKK